MIFIGLGTNKKAILSFVVAQVSKRRGKIIIKVLQVGNANHNLTVGMFIEILV